MCTVSLMVVSRLRTWSRPFSRVFSLINTVKSTPISSYLKHRADTDGTISQHSQKDKPVRVDTEITLLCIQLFHWWGLSVQIPRPHRDFGLHKLLHESFTELQNENMMSYTSVVAMGNFSEGKKWRCVCLTCLSSAVAPLPISKATLTGANAGCNFRTWNYKWSKASLLRVNCDWGGFFGRRGKDQWGGADQDQTGDLWTWVAPHLSVLKPVLAVVFLELLNGIGQKCHHSTV